MEILSAGETTPTLFDEITFVNAVEGQGLENSKKDVIVNAYAIQTNNINGDKTDPQGVWEVITNTGITETAEATIKFGQPYVVEYQDGDASFVQEVIFYEDGATAFYVKESYPEETLLVGWAAEGSYEVVDGNAYLDGMPITIGENGEYILMYYEEDMFDKCVLTPVTQAAPGKEYINYSALGSSNPQFPNTLYTLKINEDGSGVFAHQDARLHFPAGTITSTEPFFSVDNSEEIYPYAEQINCHIHPDGTRMIVNDDIYVLRSALEKELGCCFHLNNEIRNAAPEQHYGGQLWCLDCGEMVRDIGAVGTPT
jgi:hypothetical protein